MPKGIYKRKLISDEQRKAISESRKGIRFNTGRTHFKKGITPWNKGKKGTFRHTEAHKKRMSLQKGEKVECGKEIKLGGCRCIVGLNYTRKNQVDANIAEQQKKGCIIGQTLTTNTKEDWKIICIYAFLAIENMTTTRKNHLK